VIYAQDTSNLRCYGYGSQSVEVFKAIYESHAAVNMLLDLVVMALPIPLYFEPGTRGRTRLGLVGIIAMGTLYVFHTVPRGVKAFADMEASVNIFSVWRFATTIEHKAATYPTFDPSWYGPISIVMAGLETASACICASIPVFWGPMLATASQLLGQIFVTKEVHVTTEHRFPDFESNQDFESNDTIHLGTAATGMGVQEQRPYFGHGGGARLDWVGKDGVQQRTETWAKQ
jgi:hypothetical protein